MLRAIRVWFYTRKLDKLISQGECLIWLIQSYLIYETSFDIIHVLNYKLEQLQLLLIEAKQKRSSLFSYYAVQEKYSRKEVVRQWDVVMRQFEKVNTTEIIPDDYS